MANYEINVEFGKCTFEMDEEELRMRDEEKLMLEDISTGNLYFDEHRSDTKHIPFVFTPYSIHMEKLRKKINENWNLPTPRIVLFAVAETEDTIPDEYRKLSQKLVKGLVHALNTTEMWLCSDGLNSGLSRDIGKAIESEISRRKSLERGIQRKHSSFPEIALIGICPRDILTFSNKFGDGKTSKSVPELTVSKKDISRRYEYFIIVEDTTETRKGVSKLILNFTQDLTKQPEINEKADSDFDSENSVTPVMALLLHGKINQVDLILGHLKLGLPLVVFEGSGGLADILAYAYYQATCRPEGMDIAEYTESVLKPEVTNKMHEFYPKLSKNTISSLSEKIFDCIRCSRQNDQEFITVLNLNGIEYHPSKLPSLLLKALFKSQTYEGVKTSEQMKKDLFLTMDWNSADVAMEEVFARDRSSKFHIDEETFARALTKPHREDFVSLFLNQGFVIHTFLNHTNLLNLFQNSINKEFFKSVVWESVLGYGSNVNISRSFLDSKLIILIEELTGIPSILNSYELDWNYRAIYDDRSPQEAERKAVAVLVLWAVLSYRVQLVKILWQHSEQPIHLALACSIILRKLETYVTDLSLKNEMEKHSREFSMMAVNVMTLCYESVPCRALDLLHEKNRVWSHKALMEIAAFAKNKMFLAHPSCQKSLDNLFMGNIRIRDLPYGDVTVPLWLKIIFSTFFIFPMYIWVRFETPKENRSSDNKPSTEHASASNEEKEVALSRKQKEKPKEPGFFSKVYYLWSAPISKFWVYMVFYFFFLVFYSLAVIWPSCGNVYLDFFACIWIATIIMDAIYHAYTLNKQYSSMPLMYKAMEISLMIIFLFSYAMSRLIWIHTFMTPYNTKVMLCIALLYFYYRLIFVAVPISSELGPMLYRVKRMTMVDFMSYIRVTILVIISNGLVIHTTIYPDYPISKELFRRAFYDAIISFFLTPAEFYGEPNPSCIRLHRHPNRISFYGMSENVCKVGRYYKPECPNPGVWPYMFGLQYFIILRLILLVLLFALFSNTARKLEEQGKYIWKYQRYELVINFSNRLAVPPPLCIITFIYKMCQFILRFFFEFVDRYIYKFPAKQFFRREAKTHDKLDENDFRYWRSSAMLMHNKMEHDKVAKMTVKKRKERIDSLTVFLKEQRRTLRDLDCNLNELQIEINNAHQYLEASGIQASVRERLYAKNVPQIFSRISPYPNTVVIRFPVSDNHVPWSCTWTLYDPIAFTQPKEEFPKALRSHVDVDIQRLREIEGDAFHMPHFNWNKITVSPGGVVMDRQSWITDKSNRIFQYDLDIEDLPQNPLGRTGLRGRGCLPRWGPNRYIYIVITRWQDHEALNKYLEIVLMKNNNELLLPGGYVHTDNRYEVIRSHFQCEEAWRESENMTAFFESLKQQAAKRKSFSGPKSQKPKDQEGFLSERIKMGYMDADINTDQAWCEAEVWHYHYNVPCSIGDVFKGDMEWHVLSEEILLKVPIAQADIMHSIAKKQKAILEVM